MPKPTITQLRATARKRSELLRKSEAGLLESAEKMERKLNTYVSNRFVPSLDIKSGVIQNTTENLRKINKASGLKGFIKNVVNVFMFGYYDKQYNNLNGATVKYFAPFEPSAAAEERILTKGGLIIDGFVDSLFDNNDIVKGIQTTIRNGISSEQNLVILKNLLTDQITGKEEKFGSIKSFHYKNGYDSFQSYSRSLDEAYSKNLNLNYAIYAGGEIKTTRQFCDERNGNVYNRETILSWNEETWQGMKPNNNILIDMGGFNCRHDFDWISWQLAKRIDPNIEKSTFDDK